MTSSPLEPELLNRDLAAAYFWSVNCPKCKLLGPSIESFMRNKGIAFIKIDVDVEEALASRYDVLSLPTLIFFRRGQEELRLTSGKISMKEVQEAVNKLGSIESLHSS